MSDDHSGEPTPRPSVGDPAVAAVDDSATAAAGADEVAPVLAAAGDSTPAIAADVAAPATAVDCEVGAATAADYDAAPVIAAADDSAPMVAAATDDSAEPGIRPFSIAFAAGVTVTKWTRLWTERQPTIPLNVFPTEPADQVAVVRDSSADVSFVRLPIDQAGLSVIALYSEVQVVVVPKDHPASVFESVTAADLADEHLLQEPDGVPEWREVAVEIAEGTRRPLLGIRSLEDAVEQVAAGVGIVIVPQAIARLHSRKDVVYRPVTDIAETQVALVWVSEQTTPLIEEFVGIVRGRSASSSRAAAVLDESAAPDVRVKKLGPVAKAKAKARAAQEAEDAAAKRAGKRPASGQVVRKKKQSDAANAAQARRRKFGGKR